MTKKVEQIYRKLTEIEHVLQRPGRYLGTTAASTQNTYLIKNNKVVWGDVNYSPAFLKLFDEIISNSADFSKRPEGKHLNKIEVEIDRKTGSISIFDNGGIPVVKHTEYNQYVPDMIFGELRSGSNFNDDEESTGTGQNGEGSTLTNIFSKEFTVDTADGKNRFLCTYHDNMSHKDVPKVTKSSKSYTKITYIPDYTRLNITLDDDHVSILERRVYEIAATNPHIKVYLNGTLINFKSFNDFTKLFSENKIDFGNDRMQISLFHSKNGFQQIGFVNSTNVFQGGTHVEYISDQIISGVRDYIKKKTKQDIKPSEIKNHFFLITNSTINNPRYNSQTKEKLETQPKDYGFTYKIDEKTIKKIIKSDVIEEIILWAEHKQMMQDLKDLANKNKDLANSKGNMLRDITKYEPATSKVRNKCVLFITEGDSAGKALQSARDPSIHGIYPLKGKPMNVRGKKLTDLIENKELNELMKIIGLQFGKEPFIYELRYSKLVISADQDLDGFHLCGLLIDTFQQLWPGLIKQGFLVKLQTPIVRVNQGKQEIDFMSLEDFKNWEAKQTKSFTSNYLKGLGSNDTKYFKQYMFQEKYMSPIKFKDKEDADALDIAFDKTKADDRKRFIYGEVQ